MVLLLFLGITCVCGSHRGQGQRHSLFEARKTDGHRSGFEKWKYKVRIVVKEYIKSEE